MHAQRRRVRHRVELAGQAERGEIEVEAALDDVNLGRLITLFEQLREKSQLIIITHQKRTMEVADALYGVTMRSGVTEVISQRLRTEEAA